jgi:hypothetical protein
MDEKFSLAWDPHRPLLHETLRSGVWVQAEDDAYVDRLAEALRSAPAGGFDVLSDAREFTMQEESSSDDESYDMLANAGCRRFIQVVSKLSVGMQTARMIRESAQASRMMFRSCSTFEEAEALLAEPLP